MDLALAGAPLQEEASCRTNRQTGSDPEIAGVRLNRLSKQIQLTVGWINVNFPQCHRCFPLMMDYELVLCDRPVYSGEKLVVRLLIVAIREI